MGKVGTVIIWLGYLLGSFDSGILTDCWRWIGYCDAFLYECVMCDCARFMRGLAEIMREFLGLCAVLLVMRSSCELCFVELYARVSGFMRVSRMLCVIARVCESR